MRLRVPLLGRPAGDIGASAVTPSMRREATAAADYWNMDDRRRRTALDDLLGPVRGQLSEPDRRVAMLSVLNGWSVSDIQSALGRSAASLVL